MSRFEIAGSDFMVEFFYNCLEEAAKSVVEFFVDLFARWFGSSRDDDSKH